MADARGGGVWAAIAAAATLCGPALADRVELSTGDVITGEVLEQTDKLVVIQNETLGRVELPLDQVVSISLDADTEPKPVETPPPAEEKKEKDWTLALDFSFTSVSGNTDEVNLRFGATFNRETPGTRLSADMSYFLKTTSSTVTDNKLTIGARHDWLLPESRWFIFVGGRFDWDQFESWEQRINAQVGPGYNLIKKGDIEGYEMILDVLAGLGFRQEFGSANDDLKAEALLGVDYVYQITQRIAFDINFYYYPTLTALDDYRLRSAANFRYVIEQELNLSLLIGYILEYQSIVNPGNEQYDFRFFVGIQYVY